MCGRFAFFSPQEALQLAFGTVKYLHSEPRFNIAPSQDVLAITRASNNGLVADNYRWGLVPFWAKDPAIGNRMINARAETLTEKPSFRQAYSRRRCLIPASGFYEWQKQAQGKQPIYISHENQQPLAFAGLWEQWQSPDGEKLKSCTIITTAANEFMRDLHHRMPVCLSREMHELWLAEDSPRSDLDDLVKGPQDVPLQAWPVSRRVNNPVNDTADLVEPVSA
jgi:putative SOS response-associated peptidase YedK